MLKRTEMDHNHSASGIAGLGAPDDHESSKTGAVSSAHEDMEE